jgi:AraC-like DNA-binding protein
MEGVQGFSGAVTTPIWKSVAEPRAQCRSHDRHATGASGAVSIAEQSISCTMTLAPLPGLPPSLVSGDNGGKDSREGEGLSMRRICHWQRQRHLGHVYATPVLALWTHGHNDVDARRSGRRHFRYEGHARRFDFWAAGEYAAILCGATENVSLHIELPPAVIERLCPEAVGHGGWQACRFQFIDTVLERLVLRLGEHAAEAEPLSCLYTDALSAAIVQRLVTRMEVGRRISDATPLPFAMRRRLVDLIESHLAEPPSLDDLALAVGMRTAAFLKVFRASFGVSPHQYLLARRVERAKTLLQRDVRLIDIALSLGFVSHAHFSGTFRARTGLTPSDWRRGNRRYDA